jgi:aspartate/methionine/tyrosine aminotransferase
MARVATEHLIWSKHEAGKYRFNLADSAIATPDLDAMGLPHSVTMPRQTCGMQAELERMLGARIGAPGGRVLVTAGASEANACVFGALLATGDEALLERPGYEPHRSAPLTFGGTVRTFDRPLSGKPGAIAAAVEQALTPRTRLVAVSDLHNPSGTALEPADVEALDALARRRGFRILCDETFRDADRRPLGTVAGTSAAWVTTSSLTKSYGLGGLRIGWVAGDETALRACEDVQDAISVEPSHLSVALARALVPHLNTLRARTHQILARNHARWEAFEDAHERFRGTPSRGTTMWRSFGSEGEGDAFAAFAAEHEDLAIARGGFFGDSRGIRLTLGIDPERYDPALEALARASAAFRWSETEAREPA